MWDWFLPPKSRAAKALARAFQGGDFQEAVRQYEQALARDPNDHEILNNLGVALLEVGQTAKAVARLKRANEIHECAEHWDNLGRAFLEYGDYPIAHDAFLKARQLDPANPQPWYNLAVLLRRSGRREDSFAELSVLSVVHPEHAMTHNDLGAYYAEHGQPDQAVACLERAVHLAPNLPMPRLNLIRLYCQLQRLADSTRHLEALAERGVQVVVQTQSGRLAIVLNGETFYEGAYEEAEF